MKPVTKKPRVVLDTNVFLSGLLFGGKPADLVSKGILGEFQIIISKPILVELGDKLIEKFSWPEDKVEELIDVFLESFELAAVEGDLRVIEKDPKDNPVLETALKGKASYLITGDKHILELKNYGKIKIVTVAQFLKVIKN